MSAVHRKRLTLVVFLVVTLGVAVGLILYAFSQNINLFYTPTQCAKLEVPKHKVVRLGGMVVKGSVQREADLNVAFTVTDFQEQVTIHYRGILPDLFREGQGIVAMGKFDDNGKFQASEVLAKHDEKYMPPEVAASLQKTGAPT